MVQWLRIHLPKQETWVHSPVWEDPTCHEAAKAVRHNYQAGVLETMLCTKKATTVRNLRTATGDVTPAGYKQRKPVHSNEDPAQSKINKFI